nr:protein MOR1 [Tanacetum cinerariifolium]
MLAHCIDTSKKAVILKVHNDYIPICIECLKEGTPEVREAALSVMAAITNVYLYFLITKEYKIPQTSHIQCISPLKSYCYPGHG